MKNKTFLIWSLFLGAIITLWLKQSDNDVVIGFGGDTMLGRLVNTSIRQNGYRYPWGDLIGTLKSTDLNIVNLETTITKSKKAVQKVFNFRSDPDNVETLKAGSISVVSLANNHSLDFAYEGLAETIKTLDAAGIKHVGAGNSLEAASKPVIINKKGIRIGIIGFTDNEQDWIASKSKPGTNYIKVGDIKTVQDQIKDIRRKVDILIATVHWGPNMRLEPSDEFIEFAHKFIDSGVDIFHGHSAHVIQGVEAYNGKLIMYDSGDLIDDYKVDASLRNDLSFFFKVTINKSGVKKLALMPVVINNMQVNKATGNNKLLILDRMKRLSARLNTTLQGSSGSLELSF